METSVKEEKRKPQLTDVVFGWSIQDILNKGLYRKKVNRIQDTFSSADHYLTSFISPLVEETHADLRSNLTTLRSAPSSEILHLNPIKLSEPSTDLFYGLKLRKVKKKAPNEYAPEFGDLIALTEVRPRCIDDLNGRKWPYCVALVQQVRVGKYGYFLNVVSSTELATFEKPEETDVGEENAKTSDDLFAVYLTNLNTNIRIWNALHSNQNTAIINSVLRINPSMEGNCGLCLEKSESSELSESRDLLMSLNLDDSQREAVLKCISLTYCNHRESVKLIWGPPGTGKTKTIASLLFSLYRIKCRTLTCAPTNVAVSGVAKRLMSCLNGTLEYDTYGLGDVVLYGNGMRMNIKEHEDLHDVFLDYRIAALWYCLAPESGWRGCVDQMIRLLEDPKTQYLRFLKGFEDVKSESESESEDHSDEDGEENTVRIRLSDKNLLRILVIQNAEKNRNEEAKRKARTKNKHADAEGSQREIVSFSEFFTKNASTVIDQITLYTEWLYTHMPTSHLPSFALNNMITSLALLQTLQDFLRHNDWSEEALIGDEETETTDQKSSLYGIKLQCLEMLKLIRGTEIPTLMNTQEVSNFILKHACLILSTVSSSSKLHVEGMSPIKLVIIDEAAQVKECESFIPLQVHGLHHAILVGDEKQLPAMVMSEICERAGFGRSLFERLVILGHTKHLLNIQYRMHPSISLFPNKEFYGNQIKNGLNVKQRGNESQFLNEKIFGPYSFINICNGKEDFDNRNSRKNTVEAFVVAEIVSKLHKECMKSTQKVRVGCISPYKAQVAVIQELLGKKYSSDGQRRFSVNVRSVDGFQGGEEDIIIISTVRSNMNGSVGFLANLQRANVALTRAKHSLWILGNDATLQNSGTVWRRLVMDAKTRGCFHNADEDRDLSGAIRNALIDAGQQRSLFTTDSILFKAAKWKVSFSGEFKDSITKYWDSEIQKEVVSILQKLSNGWRGQKKEEVGIQIEGVASQLLEWEVVKGELRLVWTIDIVRENSTDIQAIKVLDILPKSEVIEVAKKIEVLAGDYTMNQMNRCLLKRTEGGLTLPMSWPVDRSNSRSNYSTNDLATQLAATSLRNDLPSASIRNATKWRN